MRLTMRVSSGRCRLSIRRVVSHSRWLRTTSVSAPAWPVPSSARPSRLRGMPSPSANRSNKSRVMMRRPPRSSSLMCGCGIPTNAPTSVWLAPVHLRKTRTTAPRSRLASACAISGLSQSPGGGAGGSRRPGLNGHNSGDLYQRRIRRSAVLRHGLWRLLRNMSAQQRPFATRPDQATGRVAGAADVARSHIEAVAEYVGGRIGGHLVQLDWLAGVRVGDSRDVDNRRGWVQGQPGDLRLAGHSGSQVFTEPDGSMPEVTQPGVYASGPGVLLRDGRAFGDLAGQVGHRHEHRLAVQDEPARALNHRFGRLQLQGQRYAIRRSSFIDANLIHGQGPVLGVGRPDCFARGPALRRKAGDPVTDDRPERSYEDACAFPGDCQPFIDEDGECLPCRHAGNPVLLHQGVLPRQAGTWRVLALLHSGPELGRDLAIPRRVLRHGCGTNLARSITNCLSREAYRSCRRLNGTLQSTDISRDVPYARTCLETTRQASDQQRQVASLPRHTQGNSLALSVDRRGASAGCHPLRPGASIVW